MKAKKTSEWFTPEPNSGCWIWEGHIRKDGYGHIRRGGRMVLAHRLVYAEFTGRNIDGACLLHKCDNRACVNPDHLREGTYADNNRDAREKGRAVFLKGEQNGSSKLTEEAVRRIRNDNRSAPKIAAEYGVSSVLVNKIKRRAAWKHVA